MSEQMISKGNYAATEAALDVHTAGLEHMLQFVKGTGVDGAFMECRLGYCKRAVASGHSQDELTAVFEVMKKKQLK